MRVRDSLVADFSPNVTAVYGENGTGKTTLLEAITIALRGKSFRGSDREIIKHSAEWYRIEIVTSDGSRVVKYQPNAAKSKQFIVDDKTSARLTAADKYPVVLFEPDDLRVLHGSPARRRDFIDKFAAQLVPDYSRVLSRYNRALIQRNKLLKQSGSDNEIFAWDVNISQYGARIIEVRTRLIERLNERLSDIYNTISQTDDKVSVHYSHTLIGNIEQKLMNDLSANHSRDQILGYTSTGPHRHDILFRLNDMPAEEAASRGEVRTIILAMKFIEVDLLQEVTTHPPIILLDDVLSELDGKRQKQLSTRFKNHQIILTSTDLPKGVTGAKKIKLTN